MSRAARVRVPRATRVSRAASVARAHAQVRVSPVRVVVQVVGENRAKRRLVLGHQPWPLGEHVAHARGEQRRIIARQLQRVREAVGNDHGEAADSDVDETHVGSPRGERQLGRRKRSLMDHEPIDERR